MICRSRTQFTNQYVLTQTSHTGTHYHIAVIYYNTFVKIYSIIFQFDNFTEKRMDLLIRYIDEQQNSQTMIFPKSSEQTVVRYVILHHITKR